MGETAHTGSARDTRQNRSGERPDLRVGAASYTTLCYTCPYTLKFGAAKINAQLAADRHGRAHPHHVVAVTENKVIQLRMEQQPQLFRTDDIPF
jgi:hypothetical protein